MNRRRKLLLAALVFTVITSCTSDSSSATAELDGLIEERDTLSECEYHVTTFSSIVAGTQLFESMQAEARSLGPENVTDEYALRLRGLEEEIRIGSFTHSPAHSVGRFQPGETTIEQLTTSVGLREFISYMLTITEDIDLSEAASIGAQHKPDILYECDARASNLLSFLCDDGDGEACRRLEQAATRDPARIAGACELTPYLLFCDMDDRPPLDLPPLDDE